MKNLINTLLSLCLIAAVPVVSAGDKVSPETIEGAATVDATKAKQLFDSGVLFVDVRKDKDWSAGRVPDAVHIELKKIFSEATLGKEVGKDEPLVIYCNGASCMRSSKATAQAVSWGYSKIHYFRGGFPAWKTAGYPVE